MPGFKLRLVAAGPCTAIAGAYWSKIKQACCPSREPRGGNGENAQMNATATVAPATTTVAPASPQHMRALEHANKVRLARAELKRRVAIGEIHVAKVILDCPWEAQSMAVADLLTSQRRWGQTRCRKLLSQMPMSEKKTIGSMTERQRCTLAAMLNSAERGRAWSAAPPNAQRGHGQTPASALSTRQGRALFGDGGESYPLQPLAVLDRPGKALKELH